MSMGRLVLRTRVVRIARFTLVRLFMGDPLLLGRDCGAIGAPGGV
jgi:hypothetical protein